MLRSIKSLIGFTIGATDGEIGKVKDFYFDDETWTIRYLIVETGNWLFGRKVLIPPLAFKKPDWAAEIFPVSLSREQVKSSPDINTEKPVTRQQEKDLHEHYNWPYYGLTGYGAIIPIGTIGAPGIHGEDQSKPEQNVQKPAEDQHLRSIRDISHYKLHATDGGIGDVADFLFDDSSWKIPFIVLETGNWFTGKQILISVKNILRIDWEKSSVYVDQSKETLKNSPDFEEKVPIHEGFERIKYHYRPDPGTADEVPDNIPV